MTFDDWWGAYPTQEDYEANCRDAWEAGAASRDAEVAELNSKLVAVNNNRVEAYHLHKERCDQLRDLLRPFAALLQEHNCNGSDDQPIFQINDVKITRGDLRRALAATGPK